MKKRICMLFNGLTDANGVGRCAVDIANLLAKRNDVELTLMPLYQCDKISQSRLDKKIKVKKLFGFYFHGFSIITSLVPYSWYSKWLRINDYDIQIAFQFGLATKIIAGTTRRSNASKYAWMHCYDEGVTFRHYYEKIGHIVCVSKCNAQRLKNDIPMLTVDYNYNPVDDTKVRKLGEENIELDRPNEGLLFISVGRHSPEKGLMRLLGIVKKLKDEGYKFKLWLVGDGPQHEELVKKTRELGIDDVVMFTGSKRNPHAYTSKADVFLCSSFTEGYSTACTEAIMLGIPVITTNCSGGEEIIEEAKCGLLTDMDDESYYIGMKKVLDNPQIVEDWKKVLAATKDNFSQEKRILHLLDILNLN